MMEKHKCTVAGCLFFGGYCRLHITGSFKKPTPIAPRSKKLSEVMKKEYVPQVKEMIEVGTMCAVRSEVCTGRAQGFHHLQGRIGANLTGKNKVPCCNSCNSYIEKNSLWSINNGWKISKHKKSI